MIVYGDRVHSMGSERALAELERTWGALRGHAQQTREAGLTAALIETGKVVQGLLDYEFSQRGHDDATPCSRAATELMQAAGACWSAPGPQTLACVDLALSHLAALHIRSDLTLREPEGYAYYAVYPELYVRAAGRLERRVEQVQVIGIRSIGTALSAVVAQALHSTRRPWTVRPVGHPFARELALGAALSSELLEQLSTTIYVVVDEGPGLSGSSFLSVYRWLVAHGVRSAQVRFMPSHGGEPGGQISTENLESYRAVTKVSVSFDELFLQPPTHQSRLARAFRDELGAPVADLTDLSAGNWRALRYASLESYPASHVQQERRKYLHRSARGAWLLKFAGLGDTTRYEQRAQALASEGFSPPVVTLAVGFAAQPWLEEARPLSNAQVAPERLLAHLARYIAFRARAFGVDDERAGARPDELFRMAHHNVEELLGVDASAAVRCYEGALTRLTRAHRPVATDNKMDVHEWLVSAGGQLVKTDALDHCAAHDCIGCQDPAWDVAGACVELELDDAGRSELVRLLARQGLTFVAQQLAFMELAYLAFRAGHATMASDSLALACPDEAVRFATVRARYVRKLERFVATGAT